MSGTFDDIDVPPSLVSFAVGYEKADNVISPELILSKNKQILKKINKKVTKSHLITDLNERLPDA